MQANIVSTTNSTRKWITYDIEVFASGDWCISFYNMTDWKFECPTIWNDRRALELFIKEHTNDLFISYSTTDYDKGIMTSLLLDMDPYAMSRFIIDNDERYWNFPGFNDARREAKSWLPEWNEFNILKLVGNKMPSLKKIEANLGLSIETTKVDFMQTDKLTTFQKEQTEYYNKYDCWALAVIIHLLDKGCSYLTSQLFIGDLYNIPFKDAVSITQTKMTSQILGCKSIPQDKSFKYKFPININWVDKAPLDNIEAFTFTYHPERPSGKYGYSKGESPEKFGEFTHTYNLKTIEADIGLGGIHGATKNIIYRATPENGKVIALPDVSSLYPSMIENFKFITRAAMYPNIYYDMKNERLKAKVSKDETWVFNGKTVARKDLVNGIKLPLNALSGAMGATFNPAFDWVMNKRMCLTGELCLLNLSQRLEQIDKIQHFNLNTDAIYSIFDKEYMPIHKAIVDRFSKETNLVLEDDYLTNAVFVQRDVNNYFCYDYDTKHIKAKGVYNKIDFLNYNIKDIYGEPVTIKYPKVIKPSDFNTCDEVIIYKIVSEIAIQQVKANELDSFIIKMLNDAVNNNDWQLFQRVVTPTKGHLLGTSDRILERVLRTFPVVEGGMHIYNLKDLKKLKKMPEKFLYGTTTIDNVTYQIKKVDELSDNIVTYSDTSKIVLKNIPLDYNYYMQAIKTIIGDLK